MELARLTMASISRKPSSAYFASEDEAVAGHELLHEIFFDLAEDAPATSIDLGFSAPPRPLANRTFSIGASTMVPIFRRYCCANLGWLRRSLPSGVGLSLA